MTKVIGHCHCVQNGKEFSVFVIQSSQEGEFYIRWNRATHVHPVGPFEDCREAVTVIEASLQDEGVRILDNQLASALKAAGEWNYPVCHEPVPDAYGGGRGLPECAACMLKGYCGDSSKVQLHPVKPSTQSAEEKAEDFAARIKAATLAMYGDEDADT